MAAGDTEVTLRTLHGDLTTGFADVKTALADLKATMITGFAGLPVREQSEEMVRILRNENRRNDERFTHLDVRTRDQHLETQQALRALVEGQRVLIEGQRSLTDGIRRLIARIDAFLRGLGNGEPA
jgi:hypothetical protein